MQENRENSQNIILTEAVYYILLSLLEPMHGDGIMQNVSKLSKGRVNLAAGTLYGAINTMLEKGWIKFLPGEQSSRNSRKKEYKITENGKTVLENEFNRLRELVRNGRRIIEDELE
jgi:DNA-binding PadR family transcriptional regulator